MGNETQQTNEDGENKAAMPTTAEGSSPERQSDVSPPSEESSQADALAEANESELQRTEIRLIDFEGTLPFTVCAPTGLDSCGFLGSGERRDFGILVERGSTKAFNLEVSWDAKSSFTETLEIVVDLVESCGDGCWRFGNSIVSESASPALISSDNTTKMGEGQLAILVRPVSATPNPIYSWVATGDNFRVVGAAEVIVS